MTKLTKLVLLTMMLAVCSINIKAQETIRGTVIDYLNQPMQGVTVEIVGRSEHTVSDIDGIFKLEVPVKVTKIRLSYPGVKPHEFYVTPNMVVKYGKYISYSHLRSLFDFSGGIAFGEKFNIQPKGGKVMDIHPALTLGFNLSIGYQLTHQLFLGGGFGIKRLSVTGIVDLKDYNDEKTSNKQGLFGGIYVPVFAEARWDLNLEKGITPFADLKAGYQFCLNGSSHTLFGDYSSPSRLYFLRSKGCGSLLLEPTIGVRFKLSKHIGVGFGVSYTFSLPYKYSLTDSRDNPVNFEGDKKYNASSLSFNLIFDIHKWESY